MDNHTGKCARLSPNTKESQMVTLAFDVKNNSKVLVAELFTKRRVNVEALSRTLKSMWRLVQDFKIRDLDSDTILIIFSEKVDTHKILS